MAVFTVALYYVKDTLVETFTGIMRNIALGEPAEPQAVLQAIDELEGVLIWVLVGAIVFALLTGFVAAHITLQPTRRAFLQQKRFIGAIAHELRTPLAVLRTQNEVALYDIDEKSPLREVITGNIEEIQRLKKILNNLLVFNRIDTSEAISFAPTNLEPIVHSVIESLEKLSAKHRVLIDVHIAPLPDIYANDTAVQQAIYNVLKNAILYSKENGGTVRIDVAHQDGQYAVVTIADNGKGIPQHKLRHVFEPFYRISDYNEKGLGLGLALVFEIMKLHKGTIEISSIENEKTVVTLKFPFLIKSLHKPQTHFSEDSVKFDFQHK